jgi:dTMP kinase
MFITLEGPDGSGKSTQAPRLAAALESRGHTVCLTREPGGTQVGERIRNVVLNFPSAHHTALADALLFSAARTQLVTEVIRPALARGEVVVCDRYVDSTTAYQGHGGRADLRDLAEIGRIATGGLVPDLTILIDVPVEAGLARRQHGPAEQMSRFEQSDAFDLAFHERVRAAYLGFAAADPVRWRVVDGTGDEETVAAAILAAVFEAVPELV